MKKISFRALFIILIVAASISAQVFISEKATSNEAQVEAQLKNETSPNPTETDQVDFEIEIIKTLIKRGKRHLPISGENSSF